MITDEKFTAYIGEISDQYEALKDVVYKHVDFSSEAFKPLLEGLAKFRDITCTALRESHTTKNFGDN